MATAEVFDVPARRVDADRATVQRWTVWGVVFGCTFPMLGILVASGGSLDIVTAHAEQSVLYIVDLAPLVLGAVGALLGRTHGRLVSTREAIEHTVQERTVELETALGELQDAHTQLVQAQKLEAIGSLAAGVAHEINTPIQYVGDNVRFLGESFADFLLFQDAALELTQFVRQSDGGTAVLAKFEATIDHTDLDFLHEEIPSATEQALEGVTRVSEIVRALKEFSHPGSEDKAPVDVNKAVQNALAVSRSEWKYIADVETELHPNLPHPPAVSGPLNQALLIVVVNAAQALEDHLGETPGQKGRITVATTFDDETVTVTITDDAGGIPEDVQGRIFDPFFTTKGIGRGSGQGLSIARSAIVDQHGGDLSFSVTPGIGTSFTIALPREAHAAMSSPGD